MVIEIQRITVADTNNTSITIIGNLMPVQAQVEGSKKV